MHLSEARKRRETKTKTYKKLTKEKSAIKGVTNPKLPSQVSKGVTPPVFSTILNMQLTFKDQVNYIRLFTYVYVYVHMCKYTRAVTYTLL